MLKKALNKMDYIVRGLYLIILSQTVYSGDNLALLSGTLRTYQKTACDSDKISLACPRGTSITIEIAQYEKNGNDGSYMLCPLDDQHTEPGKPEIEIKPGDSCNWPNALQTKWRELEGGTWVRYSLLQTAIEACQKKTHCKFYPSPKSFEGNPCPGIRRIVVFAYKCRPYEFRSKVACENEVIQLVCNPYSRIAIYSASYGRTEYESIQCSQPQGVKEETCLVSYATETVMQICHGRRRCTIAADSSTFGNPCKPNSRMYLKIVYTCVPRRVLKDRYDSSAEIDEPHQEVSSDLNDIYDDDQFYKESEAIPPAPKLQGGLSGIDSSSVSLIDTFSDTTKPTTLQINKDNRWFQDAREILYIYIILAVIALLLICLIMLVIGRLIIKKRHPIEDGKCQSTNTTTTTTNLPKDICEQSFEESNMDLTTTMSISSISKDDQLCNTYTPSSYSNLEPGSISFALVPTSSIMGHQPTVAVGPSNTLVSPIIQRPVSTVTFHPKHSTLLVGSATLTRQSFPCYSKPQRSTCPEDPPGGGDYYYG